MDGSFRKPLQGGGFGFLLHNSYETYIFVGGKATEGNNELLAIRQGLLYL